MNLFKRENPRRRNGARCVRVTPYRLELLAKPFYKALVTFVEKLEIVINLYAVLFYKSCGLNKCKRKML